MSFLSLCIFLGYKCNVIAVWRGGGGQFVLFTKIIVLKTSVKSVTVAFIVKYIRKVK